MEKTKNSSKTLNKLSILLSVILGLYAIFNLFSNSFSGILILISAIILSPLSKRIFTKMENKKLRLLRIGIPIVAVLFGTMISFSSDTAKKEKLENQERELVKEFLKSNKDLFYLKQADSIYYFHHYFVGAYENENNLEYLTNLLNKTDNYSSNHFTNNNAFTVTKNDNQTKVVYHPSFLTDSISNEFQTSNNEKTIKRYDIQFIVDKNLKITDTKALVVFNNGEQKLFDSNKEYLSIQKSLNQDKIKNQKGYIEARIRIAKHEKLLKDFEKNCFSPYDGSHRKLVKLIKSSMHNPKSFEHVDTKFKVEKENTIVIMQYRGTNALNATVTENVKAIVNTETCEVEKVF